LVYSQVDADVEEREELGSHAIVKLSTEAYADDGPYIK